MIDIRANKMAYSYFHAYCLYLCMRAAGRYGSTRLTLMYARGALYQLYRGRARGDKADPFCLLDTLEATLLRYLSPSELKHIRYGLYMRTLGVPYVGALMMHLYTLYLRLGGLGYRALFAVGVSPSLLRRVKKKLVGHE